MYKININDNTLHLASSEELKTRNMTKYNMVVAYTGKSKSLLSYIDMLEKSNRFKKLLIHHKDYQKLKADFKGLYRIIKASGGVVLNPKGETLMIFRRGNWDLPKGKIDENEGKKAAAVREVMEETGISKPEIIRKLCKTHHTYKLKGGVRAIKTSYWYLMKAAKQDLIPQTEEDIVKAKWVVPKRFLNGERPIYSNIVRVLKSADLL